MKTITNRFKSIITMLIVMIVAVGMSGYDDGYDDGNEPCEDYQTFADPFDCTKFFFCLGNVLHHMQCPEDFHFNADIKWCDFPEKAGCNHESTPVETCYTRGEQAAAGHYYQPCDSKTSSDMIYPCKGLEAGSGRIGSANKCTDY